MARIEILEDRCKGCALCVATCPKRIIKMGKELNASGNYYVIQINQELCNGCQFCGIICPDSAINVYR